MTNDSTVAPARATTGEKPSPARQPIAAVEEVATTREYSARQMRTAMNIMAAQAGTLCSLLLRLAEEVEDPHAQAVLHACEALATLIGAVADTASGGVCLGEFEEWICGGNFRKGGAA